jgi:hypothetical protein
MKVQGINGLAPVPIHFWDSNLDHSARLASINHQNAPRRKVLNAGTQLKSASRSVADVAAFKADHVTPNG